jgi:hypothetical protein
MEKTRNGGKAIGGGTGSYTGKEKFRATKGEMKGF